MLSIELFNPEQNEWNSVDDIFNREKKQSAKRLWVRPKAGPLLSKEFAKPVLIVRHG